ncbi:segregation/condensation protein A [Yinghuangia sp. ASG 101]|uniref:segregation and condensation protein A n=1 Tax=Yinghuangia sp. ASG 101 TaxID=2896848 RepID=UPI001E2C8DFF|nr:ScpA family protein [Yinghuangia sp. ASG 101]UGQ10258.1 segregation/condensation protein A [Yinghuangia sp. ASG 101]
MSTPTPRPRARRSLGRGGAFPGGPAPAHAPEHAPDAAEDVSAEEAVEAAGIDTSGPEHRPVTDTAAETSRGTSDGHATDSLAAGTPEAATETAAPATGAVSGGAVAPSAVTADPALAAVDDAGSAPSGAVAAADGAAGTASSSQPSGPGRHDGFAVRLDNFEGPFDLLLNLIAKHKLDVTEVSLSKVTDEFIGYIRAQGADWDLGAATEFLVVAATLLDLKAARLLPVAEIEDEEDLALLEARDLLFARLLQYRAYKEIASILDERWAVEGRRYPRAVPLEERFTGMLPELVLDVDPEKFARLAARAMTPKSPKIVSIEHIHVQRVSVREQSAIVVERLRTHGALTFRALTADCPDNLHVIARFLCLLELFREAAVGFDQVEALGELHVRWTGGDEDAPEVGAEFDEQDGAGEPGASTHTSGSGEAEERER